jgi:CheY-like chemotaxis protein
MLPNRNILLVEDDRVDFLTLRRAFKDLNINNPVEHAENGEEALAYLNRNKSQLPCLILLDINMPVMNGLEFLERAKKDDRFKVIPVVVLTTSRDDQDKMESFKRGVAGYMIKTVDYNQFLELMRTIEKYWSNSEFPFS